MGAERHEHRLSLLLVLLLVSAVVLLLSRPSRAQPNTTGITCTTNTTFPCQTYAFYRASLSQNYSDLASIGDLFGVSRLMIADPSNISSSSLAAPLLLNEPLFVPITCACSAHNGTNISYANLTRTIKAGDTFYAVSTQLYQNLTTFQSVELVNPTLVPTNLTIGDDANFPIFCKCPNETQSASGVNHLVSYVVQPGDNLSSVASRFGVQEQSIVDANGTSSAQIQPFDTIFVPVSKLPNLTQPIVSSSTPTVTKERKGVITGLAIAVGLLGLLLILGIWYGVYAERKWKRMEEEEEEEKGFGVAGAGVENRKAYLGGGKTGGEMEVSLMADVSDCLDKYRVFGIEEIKEATDGFSPGSLIQGSVYKGTIDGEVYAIKKMKWNAYEELKILQKVLMPILSLQELVFLFLWIRNETAQFRKIWIKVTWFRFN